VVVVDKPASMPVHPCGRYRHNTVIFILAKVNIPTDEYLIDTLPCRLPKISVADPDPPDPRVLAHPDPLVRGKDPDPDPSIIMQK
jgi:hypothetical protein